MSILTPLQFVTGDQPFLVPSLTNPPKATVTTVANESCLFRFQDSFLQNTLTGTYLSVVRGKIQFTTIPTTTWQYRVIASETQFILSTVLCGQRYNMNLRGRCVFLQRCVSTPFIVFPVTNPDPCAGCLSDIPTDVKILCIGDSITEGGYCYSDPSTYESYLCTDLTTLSPTTTFKICNQGVGGKTMITTGVADLSGEQNPDCAKPPPTTNSYWDTSNWANIQQKVFGDFNVILLMLGTNDCQQFNWNCRMNVMVDGTTQYLDNYMQMLTILETTYPLAKVFIMRPSPACTDNLGYVPFSLVGINYESDPSQPAYRTLFQALQSIRSQFPTVTLIDLWTPFVDAIGGTDNLNTKAAWSPYLCDGIHPTPLGNQLIASVIAPYLVPTRA